MVKNIYKRNINHLAKSKDYLMSMPIVYHRQLAIFFASKVYGYLYEFLSKLPFATSYGGLALVVILCGIVLWGVVHKLNKLVED